MKALLILCLCFSVSSAVPIRPKIETKDRILIARALTKCAAYYTLESMVDNVPNNQKQQLVNVAKYLQAMSGQIYSEEVANFNFEFEFDKMVQVVVKHESILPIRNSERDGCNVLVNTILGAQK